MIDMVACLVAHVINFFLIDIVNEAQVWKLQMYESATCTSPQPVTLDLACYGVSCAENLGI